MATCNCHGGPDCCMRRSSPDSEAFDWEKFKEDLVGEPAWETADDLARLSMESFFAENGGQVMPTDDTPTPYERPLRQAMTAAERIANDDGPEAERVRALERHRAYVTRLIAMIEKDA